MCSMERWTNKLAVITGASSGIGAETAERLVEIGVNVVAVARRKKNLLELSQKLQNKRGKFYGFKADVTKEDEVLDVFQWIDDYLGPVHILINNAAVAKIGYSLLTGTSKLWKEVLDTNVLALCVMTKEAVKSMMKYDVAGHVIHINSIFGHKVGNTPLTNIYSASKHAVTALTEVLRKDFINIRIPIKVSSVSPGLVQTDMFTSAFNSIYEMVKLPISKETLESYRMLPVLESSDVADAILYVLSTPPNVQVHELIIKPLFELE